MQRTEKVALIFWSNYSLEIVLSAGIFQPASYCDNIHLPAGEMYQLKTDKILHIG